MKKTAAHTTAPMARTTAGKTPNGTSFFGKGGGQGFLDGGGRGAQFFSKTPAVQRQTSNVLPPAIQLLSDLNGEHKDSPAGGITADLTSPIVTGRVVRFQADVSPTATYTAPAVLRGPDPYYSWRVFDTATGNKVGDDYSPESKKGIVYPRAGSFRVECVYTDPNKGYTAAMTLTQTVVSEDPTLAGQLSSDSDEQEAEREIVDDLKGYIDSAAAATGPNGITPRFLACVLRQEIASTSTVPSWLRTWTNKDTRNSKLDDVKTALDKKAAGQNVDRKDLEKSIGVGQVKMASAAMAQGLIPWTEQDANNKNPGRQKISDDFAKLSTGQLNDLYTQLSWAKSNVTQVAALLTKLKNRANRYPTLTRATFGTNQRAGEIIATEYNVGATNSPEFRANSSDYGKNVWKAMSLPIMGRFTNS